MQVVTFRSAGGLHAVPVLAVEELCRPAPVTPVPGSDPRVAGLADLRGKSAAVIDLRRCFRSPGAAEAPPGGGKMILLETADRLTGEAAALGVRAFEEPVALLVDRIEDVVAVAASEVRPRPAHVAERFVAGVVRRGDGYVQLLDVSALIAEILGA